MEKVMGKSMKKVMRKVTNRYFRLSTIVLMVMMILSVISLPGIVSASEIVSLYTEGDTQGQNGQNINVKIVASGMNSVGTVAIGLVFDNSVLSVNSVSDGNVKTPDAFSTSNVNNAQGLVAMGLGNPSGINGDGTLFVINFKIIGNAGSTSSLKLSMTANDVATNVIDTSTTKIVQGKIIVVGKAGEGAGGTMEPYDNVLKYEIRERYISSIPITFTYTMPELPIYEIVVTSTQGGTALLRIDALKDTSKLVNVPAPGTVYKNANLWIDYRRVKDAFVRYKVENSWMNSNELTPDDVRMLKWDNNNKKWLELLTSVINKDDQYSYFESQTDTIPVSLAITGKNKTSGNVSQIPAVAQTPVVVQTSVTAIQTQTAAVQTPTTVVKTPVITPKNRTAQFEIGVLVYPSSFKSGNYIEILNKLESNNVTRVIVPVYDARKGDKFHIFHAETKGLGVETTASYNLDALLAETHKRNMELFVRIASFGPDPVVPTEDQKQNLKKIVNHLLGNYTDNNGHKLDGIYLDHIYYEDPLSAEGDTDTMANFVRDIKSAIGNRAKLSASVKPAYYESLLHIYLWPYMWPISGPSDYYVVMQETGQDYAKLSKNLDYMSPVSYSDDRNYAGKVTKFIKEKAGMETVVIPDIQASEDNQSVPAIQYAIESARNNGARGVNVFDYSTISDNEWTVIRNAQ